MTFKDLNLAPELLDGIADLGFDTPTEIQVKAIPPALEGKDLLATSHTGSGKTAAFALPIIQRLAANRKPGIRAVLLAPTRELAQQIDEQFWSLGYHAGVSSVCIYGGSDFGPQERALREGVNIVVATPGRFLDHLKFAEYDFSGLETLVLDEADRMLDMGFIPDVRTIINRMPKERQTFMFSATMTPRIESLAKEFCRGKFERIKIGIPSPAKGIRQVSYHVDDRDKTNLLLHLFEKQNWQSAIVFSATKRGVDQLGRALQSKGAKVETIHGDRDQKERERTLDNFKSGRVKILVATDVMARGIDVDNISHVVNFDVPNDLDDYIHRIGRTARADATGDAITFVSRKDWQQMRSIIDALDGAIEKLDVPDEVAGNSRGGRDNRDDRGSGNRGRGGGNRGRGRGGRNDRNDRNDNDDRNRRTDRNDQRQDRGDKNQNQDKHQSENDNEDGDDKQNSRRRRPKRRPSGRRTGSRNNRDNRQQNQQENNDQKNSGDDQNQNKPRRSPRGGRRKKSDNNDQNQNRNQSSKPNKSGSRGRGRSKTQAQKASPVDKRIKRQDKLIEKVQTSRIAEDQLPKKEKPGGIWNKIKNIFD